MTVFTITIGAGTKVTKSETKFFRQSLEKIFRFKLAPYPFTRDFLENFGNSKDFLTV